MTIPAHIRIVDGNTTGGTTFSVNLLLHGIGHSGDNPNPLAYSLSNQQPHTPTRNVTIEVLNGTNHAVVGTASGTVQYSETNGNFTGTVNTAKKIVPGQYLLKLKSDRYLKKYAPVIATIGASSNFVIPQMSLVTSDSNDDNRLNILDYNMILDCYSGSSPARACDNADKKLFTDANDDGMVNQYDYNLFLRELSVQNGD